MSSKQKLNRILRAISPLQKLAENPKHGHYVVVIEGIDDPYSPDSYPKGGVVCQGCGRSVKDLESADWLPVCSKPGQDLKIIIEYKSDPRAVIYDTSTDSGAVVPTYSLLEGEKLADPEPNPEPELIPPDDVLLAMSVEEIDRLYERVSKLRKGKEDET